MLATCVFLRATEESLAATHLEERSLVRFLRHGAIKKVAVAVGLAFVLALVSEAEAPKRLDRARVVTVDSQTVDGIYVACGSGFFCLGGSGKLASIPSARIRYRVRFPFLPSSRPDA
jgi:hypothetical protein